VLANDGSYVLLLYQDLLPCLPVRVRVAAARHKHSVAGLYCSLAEYAIFPASWPYGYNLTKNGNVARLLGNEDVPTLGFLRQTLD
jgi:hypothetical protein